jgi:hypothetical protein
MAKKVVSQNAVTTVTRASRPNKVPCYSGPKRYAEYREARGKTIECLRYWHSPADGQMLMISFTDKTAFYFSLLALLEVQPELNDLSTGDAVPTKAYRKIVGAPVPG